jgi:hypothetical protein
VRSFLAQFVSGISEALFEAAVDFLLTLLFSLGLQLE